LHTLSRNDVRQWVATLECSNKRISNTLSPLRAALQDAQHDDLINVNPLYNWTYKRNETPNKISHVGPFNQEEQQAIIDSATGSIRNQIITFFWTGMRASELIALEWTDIDWKRKKISVNKAVTNVGRINETTKSGKREIDMLPPVEKALIDQKSHTLLQGGKVFINPATCTQWTGDQQIRKGYWISLLKTAGVRYRNPYQTHHTYASMMLSTGENLAWVSNQMGYGNVLVTARTYARWIKTNDQQGSKALEMFGQ
jgi:integrase